MSVRERRAERNSTQSRSRAVERTSSVVVVVRSGLQYQFRVREHLVYPRSDSRLELSSRRAALPSADHDNAALSGAEDAPSEIVDDSSGKHRDKRRDCVQICTLSSVTAG